MNEKDPSIDSLVTHDWARQAAHLGVDIFWVLIFNTHIIAILALACWALLKRQRVKRR